MTLTRVASWIGVSLMLLMMSSCKFVNYSFTSGSVPLDVNTISISNFPVQGQRAAIAPPSLSQDLSEGLRDIFIQQSRLTMVRQNGDLIMEGEITGYELQNASVANNTAAQQNLVITINVRYTDTKHPENSYEQSFKQMASFDATQNLSDVESGLTSTIIESLAQDVFNKSLGNW
mgnify:CR=1 FL=1